MIEARAVGLAGCQLWVYGEAVQSRCPTCGKPVELTGASSSWRPFCSRRCKMTDLGNWLDEVYRLSRPLGFEDFEDDPSLLAKVLQSVDSPEDHSEPS